MDQLEVTVRKSKDAVTVTIGGEIDLVSGDRFSQALTEAISEKKNVRLNLANVSFMDSTGIKILVQARKLARRQGVSLKLVKTSEPVERLLGLMGLKDYFD